MKNQRTPRLSAILAMGENRVIGQNNRLPWRLPADLRHFKALTIGHPILMGRKTYESIGKPLPGRTNLIMTRQQTLKIPGCLIVHSLKEAMALATQEKNTELFIIGGAEIYQQCLAHTERIYLTLIHHVFAGDTFFPPLHQNEWQETARVRHEADSDNAYAYSFIELNKK